MDGAAFFALNRFHRDFRSLSIKTKTKVNAPREVSTLFLAFNKRQSESENMRSARCCFYDSRRIMQPVVYRWPQSNQATKSIKTHSSASTVSCVWFMINVVCSFSRCSCLLQKASLASVANHFCFPFFRHGRVCGGKSDQGLSACYQFYLFPTPPFSENSWGEKETKGKRLSLDIIKFALLSVMV